MKYAITYYNNSVQEDIVSLPKTLRGALFKVANSTIPHEGKKMLTHEELKAKMLADPEVKAEYDCIEREEMPMLDIIVAARKEAGLTQAQVAERMGTKATAVARLEASLVSGKHSPSIATLRKYAKALDKQLDIRLV